MRKIALISLLAAGTALGSYALAQPASPPGAGAAPGTATGQGMQPLPEARRDRGPFAQMTRADLEALADARVAAIQAGLKLSAEQQRLWPPVEQAIRAAAADRIARFERMRSGERPTPAADFMERLDRRTERVTQRAERVKALQGALKPLWATLDERQKRLLPILMRPGGGGGMAFAHGWRGHGGGMMDMMGQRMRERMRERMRGGGMGGGGTGGGEAQPNRP